MSGAIAVSITLRLRHGILRGGWKLGSLDIGCLADVVP